MRRLSELESQAQERREEKLINKLSRPLSADDPENTGNTHNPDEDEVEHKLMKVASLFESGNIFKKDTLGEGKSLIMELAQRTQNSKQTLAAKQAELAEKDRQIQLLRSQVNNHDQDLNLQRQQTAAMLRRIIAKTTPPPTEQDQKTLDAFETNYSNGHTDLAMQRLSPLIVRASAWVEALGAASQADSTPDQSGQPSNFMQSIRQILNPQAPLVQASAANRLNHKRSYQDMMELDRQPANSNGTNNNSALWNNIHPTLVQAMQEVEHRGVENMLHTQMPANKTNRS
jgi:hypothetical protein